MLKKIVNKFCKPQTVVLSNEEKIKALSEKAVGLFDHMKKAHDELGTINEELTQVVQSEEKRIDEEVDRHHRAIKQLTDNKFKALDEIKMNGMVQGELAKFIR